MSEELAEYGEKSPAEACRLLVAAIEQITASCQTREQRAALVVGRAALAALMKITCPKCGTSYDVPTAAVVAAARPIIAREAGRVRSERKATAARENGKKGGRPKNAGSSRVCRPATQSPGPLRARA